MPHTPFRSQFAALAVAAALLSALPAHAQTANGSDAIDAAVSRILGKVLSEQNLDLVFGLLRQSLTAAADGKPAPELSAAATARLEASGKELQREMLSVSVLVLDQVEKEVREAISAEIRP